MIIISEATDSGVVIYADGQPVRVAVKKPQLLELINEARSGEIKLIVNGDYAPHYDTLFCAKVCVEASSVWFLMEQREATTP